LDNIASLVCHPHTPTSAVKGVEVSGSRGIAGFVTLRYHIFADIARLSIPASAIAERADGLWKTTCLELFTRDPGEAEYREYNFSPSSQWAAYSFTSYREGMNAIDIWAPRISTTREENALIVDINFVAPRLGPQMIGACAVIEEKDGGTSFWGLVHPPGKPDFHHPACFVFELPAADGE
jgi:hypothetical protein